MIPMSIADIRKDYKQHQFGEQDAAASPIEQFTRWWNDAIASEIDEVNAMTLATSSADGVPSARIVLLKGYDEQGFVFFTNYNSFKGLHVAENPRACLVFFWKELERQIRITGLVEKLADTDNDQYYYSRPLGSQIGAWASPQSSVIPSRAWLENEVDKLSIKFQQESITRPAHWGGYRVKPTIVEFWQGRPSRLHDRMQYSLQEGGTWMRERLAP
jgi:pyridoxamine 5'-phosphate oxidase